MLAPAPPTIGLRSMIAARLPNAAAAAAALSPAGPEPITIRSYEVGSIGWMIPRPEAGAKRAGGAGVLVCDARTSWPGVSDSAAPDAIAGRIAYN